MTHLPFSLGAASPSLFLLMMHILAQPQQLKKGDEATAKAHAVMVIGIETLAHS